MRKHNWTIIGAMLLALTLAWGCQGRKSIGNSGVHAARLGDPMPPQGQDRLRGHAIRDTFVQEGEYQWRQVVMDYKKGRVYIEEDVTGEATVSRIRIYTPELSMANGLKVGMTAGDLKAKTQDWTISGFPEYNLLDFYSRTYPRTHFIIDDPSVPKDLDWTEYKLENVKDNARIVAIVLL
jgi:hypothetical protein